MDSFFIRNYIINLIRNLYSSPDNFIYPDYPIANVIYDKNKNSLLKIESSYLYDINDTVPSPAIYVTVGDLGFNPVVLSDMSSNNLSTRNGITKTIGQQIPVQIIHIMNDPDEALLLATNTAVFMIGYEDIMQKATGIDSVLINGVSSPSLISAASPDKKFVSSVSFTLRSYISVNVIEENNILKKVELSNLVVD